jgi:hypothetical protein
MDLVKVVFQIIIALGIVNVWVLRFGKDTRWRGGEAKTLRDEFKSYGLPIWFMIVVGGAETMPGRAFGCRHMDPRFNRACSHRYGSADVGGGCDAYEGKRSLEKSLAGHDNAPSFPGRGFCLKGGQWKSPCIRSDFEWFVVVRNRFSQAFS